MGNLPAQLGQTTQDTWALLFKRPCRIVLLGLDGAGKTTLLYRLKLGKAVATAPTACYNSETFTYKHTKFTAFDLSGQRELRNAWPCYFEGCDVLVYVVDAADRSRVDEAADELTKMLENEELKNAKLLVLANKCDQPNCMTVTELERRLKLSAATRNVYHIEKIAARCGVVGIYEALEWILNPATIAGSMATGDQGLDYMQQKK